MKEQNQNKQLMTRIGLISDTHNYLDDAVLKQLDNCDEIWHAGDFGTINIVNRLRALKPLKGVWKCRWI